MTETLSYQKDVPVVAEGVEPRNVPIPWLQDTLTKQGAFLGDSVARRVHGAAESSR